MNLIVDGKIYEGNTQGGIARIFSNILPLMCNLDPNLKVFLFTSKTPPISLPIHPQIQHLHLETVYKYFRPWRIFSRYYKKIQRAYITARFGSSQKNIWFSTYFTKPPENWRGQQVVYVFDMIYELFPELMPNSQMVINNKENAILSADKVFCISHTTAGDLKHFYSIPDEKIAVTPLSHERRFTTKHSSEIREHVTDKYILFVGKRKYYKGFATLLEAYSQWEKNQEIKLVLVGSEWLPEENSEIRKRGIEKQVKLLENVDDETLCDLYNQAEAFVYPSLYEGFGIPLLEAMACGCPIIASRIPSTEEVSEDVPYYFEPGNSASLLAALDKMSSSEDMATRITRGIEVSMKYSWHKTALLAYEALKDLDEEN